MIRAYRDIQYYPILGIRESLDLKIWASRVRRGRQGTQRLRALHPKLGNTASTTSGLTPAVSKKTCTTTTTTPIECISNGITVHAGIDKRSSAELQEAINSMFNWYANAAVCYCYLSDVSMSDRIENRWIEAFGRSRWFTRGWTLQELLAPTNVLFYDADWAEIGSKTELCEDINTITDIPSHALTGASRLDSFSIAEKMRWASARNTTRIEDQAYSLLGIFDVNMPLLYGEGHRAFRRLQEEIIRSSTDQSIFAWADPKASLYTRSGLFAHTPAVFASSKALQPSASVSKDPFTITNKGLEIRLPMAPLDDDKDLWRAVFHYGVQTSAIYLVALDDPETFDSTSEHLAEFRRFARVCTNFIDCSSWPDLMDLQTIYVPMNVDTMDHIRISDVVMHDPRRESPLNRWMSARHSDSPWNYASIEEIHDAGEEFISNGSVKRHKHVGGASLRTSRPAGPDILFLRSSMGPYQCAFLACDTSFVRRSDLKLHEEFVHVRRDIWVPQEDGSVHRLEDARINSEEECASPIEVQECEKLN